MIAVPGGSPAGDPFNHPATRPEGIVSDSSDYNELIEKYLVNPVGRGMGRSEIASTPQKTLSWVSVIKRASMTPWGSPAIRIVEELSDLGTRMGTLQFFGMSIRSNGTVSGNIINHH